jgi:antitoxin component of RelBE/YafQ-DinJ toxin-antitoxin module
MAHLKTRTLRYELRLTPVEKESWSLKASSMGLDLSEYIRRCVERRQITTTIQPEVNRQTAVELGRIGVNLNQLQRAMNTSVASGQFIPNVEESLAVVQEVYKTVKELQREFLGSDDRQNSKR